MSESARILDLLNATHAFPTVVMIKVIGRNRPEFVEDVVFATEQLLPARGDLRLRTRFTAHERHVAVTMEPFFQDAEEVLALYAELRGIEGVVMMM